MKTVVAVVPFLIAAVFNGASASSWSWITGEDGVAEIIDLDSEPEDSASTLTELKNDVIFSLNTVSNPEVSEVIYLLDDETLAASHFDANKPTRFIIHGWLSSAEKVFSTSIRNAYLSVGDYNIISVDWSSFAGKDYVTARTKIVAFGEYVGLMIDYLNSKGMNPEDLKLIGHSLGAHVAGVAGRSAVATVGSLIALDPAGPLFYFIDTNARLRSTDARFTQVIHTNTAFLGYSGALGDVDIWPNDGAWQPGCDFDVVGLCSHQRSYVLMVESIAGSSSKFTAHSCESYSDYTAGNCFENESTYLGGATLDVNAVPGNYYLTTNSEEPYCRG